MIFNRLGIDTEEVLEAAGSKWNFLPFRPGLVGGHCIGVDPYYLTHKAQQIGYHPEMILAGRRINDNMALYVAGEVVRLMTAKRIHVKSSRILVLGLAFKENTPDLRNSKVADVVAELVANGAKVDVWDPWVSAKEAAQSTASGSCNGPRAAPTTRSCWRSATGSSAMRPAEIRRLARRKHVIYDIKYLFGARPGRRPALMRVLVTGAAGFIGYHVAERLLARGDEVVGLDNLNPYYDPTLKQARLARLARAERIPVREARPRGPRRHGRRSSRTAAFERVVHLAAQAGVRYSVENPHAYADSNLTGTLHVLEGCRHHGVEHLVFASTSSVYGANTKMPFSVHQNVRPPALVLRRDQESERADGAHLRLALRPAGDGPALLHRLRPLGPAGHGAVPVHAEHPRRQADRRLQLRQPPPRLHLRRRHRGGVVAALDHVATPDAAWDGDRSGSRHEPRAVPALQHRQQPAGRADALHRGARELPRAQGGKEPAAAAGRRRARHLGRRRRPGARRRLSPVDAGRRGRREVRRLVPRLLPGRRSRRIPGSRTLAETLASARATTRRKRRCRALFAADAGPLRAVFARGLRAPAGFQPAALDAPALDALVGLAGREPACARASTRCSRANPSTNPRIAPRCTRCCARRRARRGPGARAAACRGARGARAQCRPFVARRPRRPARGRGRRAIHGRRQHRHRRQRPRPRHGGRGARAVQRGDAALPFRLERGRHAVRGPAARARPGAHARRSSARRPSRRRRRLRTRAACAGGSPAARRGGRAAALRRRVDQPRGDG